MNIFLEKKTTLASRFWTLDGVVLLYLGQGLGYSPYKFWYSNSRQEISKAREVWKHLNKLLDWVVFSLSFPTKAKALPTTILLQGRK